MTGDRKEYGPGTPPAAVRGREGEQQAVKHLKKKGYRVIRRNFRSCGSEVDIIAEREDTLCFVEVKTRQTPDFGLPGEFVDNRKIKRIIRGARVFAARKPYRGYRIRFDIISVIYHSGGWEVEHLENAFENDFQ